jgi:hypothetical protein
MKLCYVNENTRHLTGKEALSIGHDTTPFWGKAQQLMKTVRKWTRKGACTGKQGKVASGKQESQRKDERGGSKKKTVGFWTSRAQGVRKWTNLTHLGLVG